MQMYRDFEGYSPYSALFVVVSYHDPCFLVDQFIPFFTVLFEHHPTSVVAILRCRFLLKPAG